MPITFDKEKSLFTIDTKNTSYQFEVDNYGHLLHLYYGRTNPGFVDQFLEQIPRSFSGVPDVAGKNSSYSLDTLPQEYPTRGPGDFRHVALNIRNETGADYCDLIYKDYKIQKGKYALEGLPAAWANDEESETLVVTLEDKFGGIEVDLLYGVIDEIDIITRASVIRNVGSKNLTIQKAASATLDFLAGDYDLITLYGRHEFERKVERQRVRHGVHAIGSRRGASSHQYNPAVMLTRPHTYEGAGDCWGMMFVYSGNFLCQTEKDQFDQVRLTMGLIDEMFSYPLNPGDEFTTPEVVLSYSETGIANLSHNYHKCVRRHICRGKYALAPRPIVLNSWEANYFDVSAAKIINLAKQAKELNIDLVVMDDGWFGSRNDDNSSLGDWYANSEKLGEPLHDLAAKVVSYGVGFGIWFEPEMINEDSELYRKHPDWVIKIEGRPPVRSRNQLVLDFSRKEVRDHIFDQVCAILDEADICYVKWDMNRSISDIYGGRLTYDYMLGVYEFLEKLIKRYPDLLLEGCAGGGGRFDAGMMYYAPQIWTSDNTDAENRVKIHYGTSFFYPLSTMSCHVSAVPNHQTGRITSLYTRGVVSMTGAFGYELDPELLPEKEREEIKEQTKKFRELEYLISNGDYYRLTNPLADKVGAWMSVAEDKSQALLSVVRIVTEGNMPRYFVRMKGLDPNAFYKEEVTGKVYSGALLMETGYGLNKPSHDLQAYQLLFNKCEGRCE